jgi:hypothetical protein
MSTFKYNSFPYSSHCKAWLCIYILHLLRVMHISTRNTSSPPDSSWCWNARNILRASVFTDESIRMVSSVSALFELILLNSDTNTHLSLEPGILPALDLTYCSPGLTVHLDCYVLFIQCSDHEYAHSTLLPISRKHQNHIIRPPDLTDLAQQMTLELKGLILLTWKPAFGCYQEWIQSTSQKPASQKCFNVKAWRLKAGIAEQMDASIPRQQCSKHVHGNKWTCNRGGAVVPVSSTKSVPRLYKKDQVGKPVWNLMPKGIIGLPCSGGK